ncbi:hypothetical protein [Anabaena sp. CCY 9910]|uniref:hypothetical protein n=1 Tax=Anabaena sp. CCY 9910 TaxID=3103870 RepID=UPI0039E1AE22
MITHQDLKQLQSLTKVPALSILLPTHRTSPDNKQDPILVKNLVSEATKRLDKEFTSRQLEPLLKQLETLVSEINYHVPAILTEDGRFELVDQPGETDVMDDAADKIIEFVLAKRERLPL